MAEHGVGDTVSLRAIGQDGNEVEATFVLNMATNIVAESTNSNMEPPANTVVVEYMREKIASISAVP